ncbi:hypothetical protein QAD02_004716 [Eretmocerus hayati]|uniref:Uncharacterized protein n=1 Tax=Eretmocerus hayati TaxID=131215 RepID=A0ACC2NQT5_9HYME|nr:hypothetical protein QAD02_004716 [Eretmocerus hayati]
MNNITVERVKHTLNVQFYQMNDSWLSDCIEYYLNDHPNPAQEEITAFVKDQLLLNDLRETSNEKGCLPRNLSNQKLITLPGKYMLQMDKMYDISVSKYKQLEKIRNISSENVDATENENATHEDKFQAWEPKPKRMLQLFLTDGVQDVLAIEYQPIRFLKDTLDPGCKVLIKGPVKCRRGVILLEESNFAHVGGEVENLLIPNAVENIFARALNLEENPDPYHDTHGKKAQDQQEQIEIEDDFDTQMIDQIDEQIPQSDFNDNRSSTSTMMRNEQRQNAMNEARSRQQQKAFGSGLMHHSQSVTPRNQYQSNSSSKIGVNKIQESCNTGNPSRSTNFEDDDDSFLNMVDDKMFESYSAPKSSSIPLVKSITSKQTPASSARIISTSNEDDFPVDDEIYDFFNENPMYSKSAKSEAFQKSSTVKVEQPTDKKIQTQSKFEDFNKQNLTLKLPSPLKPTSIEKPSTSTAIDFPDDDFDMNNYEPDDLENFKDLEYDAPFTNQSSSISSLWSKNSSKEGNTVKNLNSLLQNEFSDEMDIEFEAKPCMDFKKPFMGSSSVTSSNFDMQHNENTAIKHETSNSILSGETTGSKRLSSMSPTGATPQKVRCLENSPSTSQSSNRKITDFLKKTLLNENTLKMCEFLCDVLKRPTNYQGERAIVRGKVVSIVKLNLLKDDNGSSYFHLEGTITDNTADLDIVFSSEVLEKVIEYTPQEFKKKRKQSKLDPSIKVQLTEDLRKAQDKLRSMDALMEVEIKTNAKAKVICVTNLSKKEITYLDESSKSRKK